MCGELANMQYEYVMTTADLQSLNSERAPLSTRIVDDRYEGALLTCAEV